MIALRCDKHQHARVDLATMTVFVKCRWCSKDQRRPVHHEWPLLDIADRVRCGETIDTCPPTPQFVHWRVIGSG